MLELKNKPYFRNPSAINLFHIIPLKYTYGAQYRGGTVDRTASEERITPQENTEHIKGKLKMKPRRLIYTIYSYSDM